MPNEALHKGKIDPNVYVAYCHLTWAGPPPNIDPAGSRVDALTSVFRQHQFARNDLFVFDYCSFWRKSGSQEFYRFKRAMEILKLIVANARVISIVLPVEDDDKPLLESAWVRTEMVVATYVHRVLYDTGSDLAERAVKSFLQPKHFYNLGTYIDTAHIKTRADIPKVKDVIRQNCRGMTPTWKDRIGFDYFCNEAQIAWLRVWHVRKLANKSGPFPRRQELESGGICIGAPPCGVRVFAVSHPWETAAHPSPSGGKLVRLLKVLDGLDKPAENDDVVFLDFVSVPQEGKISAEEYFRHNGISASPLPNRTPLERRKFDYMIYDMMRLYAFEGVEVVILPEVEHETTFPGGNWGFVNKKPYQNRGWCCLEFSVASYHGRIANIKDAAVHIVKNWRFAGPLNKGWPKVAEDFDELVDKDIFFTNRGDWDRLKFNFYKMTVDIRQASI